VKVAIFKSPGRPLHIEDAPRPIAGHGQAVVKVGRCGICSTDLFMTSGQSVSYPLNSVIGHEVAGEVLEIGPGVERLRVGDHVAAFAVQCGCGRCPACLEGVPHWCTGGGNLGNFGGFAQISKVQELFTLKLPDTLSMADGALVEPLACALHGVHLAKIDPGARVLVMGAGPIGLGSCFWARRLGAGKIAVMARSNRRKDMAMRLGADVFIDKGAQADTTQAVQSALGGLPDVVLECTGAAGMFAEAISQVRPRGTVVELGFCAVPDTFVPAAGLGKEATIRFSMMYNLKDYQVVADVLDAGHVDPRIMITETISLDQLPSTFEALRSPNEQCKVLVDPWA
jgi:threonine dehydrogenase-like Zn-dependent dehydrogenase